MRGQFPGSLQVSGLSYLERLSGVSFSLLKGEILAVLGPNGSGKTTLLKCISGILSPPRGSIFFQSLDVTSYSCRHWAEKMQYVTPTLKVDFPITVSELFSLGNCIQSSARDVIAETGCEGLERKYLEELSSGELSRIAFAQALMRRPHLLLLDETFSFMDLDYQARMGALLRKYSAQGMSIVLVSHDYHFATEWATQVLFLKEGKKVAFGKLVETFTQETLSHLYPASRVSVVSSPSGKPKVFFEAEE